jgi:hypothetical protein
MPFLDQKQELLPLRGHMRHGIPSCRLHESPDDVLRVDQRSSLLTPNQFHDKDFLQMLLSSMRVWPVRHSVVLYRIRVRYRHVWHIRTNLWTELPTICVS